MGAETARSFLPSLFLRLARSRGLNKAVLAVAHRILIIAYHILRDGVVYRELGRNYHDQLHPQRTKQRLVTRLEGMGYGIATQARSGFDAGT